MWPNLPWKPPYAPDFEPQANFKLTAGGDFTPEAINARRAQIEAMRSADNTEFIPDMVAYRCKACSTMHAHWLDAFECHKKG